MEKTIISCPQCGHRLATILGENGARRRIEPAASVRVRVERNALGEYLGWLRCRCKTYSKFDAALQVTRGK